MSENVAAEKKNSKLVIILIAALIVLVIGGVITAVVLLNRSDDKNSADGEGDGEPVVTIGYQGQGVVALDEDEFQRLMEEMQRQAEEGMIDLTFKNVASSEDGVNFECKLGNPISNRYDEYFQILLDNDVDKQIALTGLISPGQELSSFESEIPLDVGEYSATLVITQIEDDHATIHGQTYIALTLVVSEEYEFDDSIFD